MTRRAYSLTPEQQAAIVTRRMAGEKIEVLAAEFAVDKSYPGRLVRRKAERVNLLHLGSLPNPGVTSSAIGTAAVIG